MVPSRAGRLFQLIAVSDQPASVAYTAGPLTVELVAYSRSSADVTVPLTPLTSNRTKDSSAGSLSTTSGFWGPKLAVGWASTTLASAAGENVTVTGAISIT